MFKKKEKEKKKKEKVVTVSKGLKAESSNIIWVKPFYNSL